MSSDSKNSFKDKLCYYDNKIILVIEKDISILTQELQIQNNIFILVLNIIFPNLHFFHQISEYYVLYSVLHIGDMLCHFAKL